MATPRKPISKAKRFRIFDRDGFSCVYCGRTPPAVVLEIDHVQPLSAGGTDDSLNLVTSCFDCNRGKGAAQLGSAPQVDVRSMARSMKERADQLEAYQKHLSRYAKVMDQMVDSVGEIFWSREGPNLTWNYETARTERLQVRRFIERLNVEDCRDAARIAVDKMGDKRAFNQWRYFCGICWNWIRSAEGKT